jgi:predicted DNA-binding transcriptional regulator YafY
VSTPVRRPVDPRIVRVIKCLRLLEAACYSAEDLAGRLQVSKRTVYRDLRLIAAAGVPLARRIGDGGYHVSGPGA